MLLTRSISQWRRLNAFNLTARSFFMNPRLASARRTMPSSEANAVVNVANGGEASADSIAIDPSRYPIARKDASVVDNFHGTGVADPYRWMENPDGDETKTFVDECNKVSEPFLNASGVRETMRARLTELWDYEKYGCTAKRGKFYYYSYNTGLQNQNVIYQQTSLDAPGKVFLDPNTLSSDGTTSVRQTCWTEDGEIYAYGLSEKGSDWVTVRFKKASGEELPDVITGVKHSDLAWMADNSGIFYSRYPDYKGALEGSTVDKQEYHSLFFHKMGTNCEEDLLVADFRHDPNIMVGGEVSEDGRYLVVSASKGCDPTNQLFYYDLAAVGNKIEGKLKLKPLFDKSDAKYDFVDSDGDSAIVQTNHEAPMFKVIRVKFETANDGPSNWETLIAENERHKLDWVAPVAGDRLVAVYLEDVKNTMYVHSLKDGARLQQIPIDIGSITSCAIKKTSSEMFFSFESFFTPTVVYQLEFGTETPTPKEIRRVKIPGVDFSQFAVKQVFYPSKDGTKIPMYILHRKDVVLDGNNPTILNGYGGFNVADEPYFSVTRLLVLQHFHGVVVNTNLRGGSEYGEKWHEAGMRERKQNVFDDFISAAEYLIENKYTNPSRLAIHGGSNGGLLVAACSQQRPELYGAVLNRVGVMDMLRFHKFTVGSAWIPEYGNPDVEDDFKFIYKYSPLHNLRMPDAKGQWPATMLMTADHDDRVVPSHSLKYMATLYNLVASEAKEYQRNPLIMRVEVKAGHGAGKPTSKIIAEIVDMYSFLQRVLKMTWF
ncbi:hypothetical protein QR680_018893 [Steinernema hermaphroditum]|uniref:Prolyl endopeptidase n=1 Tax=Steinernema hermaphroditum TaxID=289476 RepID=A0AA39HJC4_9BILA|nr:hypothetical protein QR680_018893 [Steinernema hermaphroditum]